MQVDNRFSQVLFCSIHSVVTNANGTMIINFTNVTGDAIQDHKVSIDKIPKLHCYHKLKAGAFYCIYLTPYKHRNGRRWLWTKCVELRCRDMMNKTYSVYKDTNNIRSAMQLGGVSRWYAMKSKYALKRKQQEYIDTILEF